jgi:hypothetical protein
MPLRRLGYGVSVSHRMMPSNITSVSNGSVSALVLCLRSESRNLFRQSDLALHLRKWVRSSTGCWQDWHSLGYSVALYLATIFPVASHPWRNWRRNVGGDLVRLSLRCAYCPGTDSLLVAGPVDPLGGGVCPFVLCLHVSEDCLLSQHVKCYAFVFASYDLVVDH